MVVLAPAPAPVTLYAVFICVGTDSGITSTYQLSPAAGKVWTGDLMTLNDDGRVRPIRDMRERVIGYSLENKNGMGVSDAWLASYDAALRDLRG